jgi:hypothetical protein
MVKAVWTEFAIEDLRQIHTILLRIKKLMRTGLLIN